MEALYMIVGSKEVVEYSISHIPLVYGVDRVGVPSSNPCSLKVGDKCTGPSSSHRYKLHFLHRV